MEMAKGKRFIAERSKPFFILVLATMFIVASASFAFSQANRYESIKGVKFKDGTVLMGTVTQLNVETVTIRLENGQTVVRKFDDVDTFIKRDDAVRTYQETKPAAPPATVAAPAAVPSAVPSAAPPTTAPAAAPAAQIPATPPSAAPVAAPAAAPPAAAPAAPSTIAPAPAPAAPLSVNEPSSSGSLYESRSISSEAKFGGYLGVFGGYALSPDATFDWQVTSSSYDLDVENTWILGIKLGFSPSELRFFSFEFEYSYFAPDINRTILEQIPTDFLALEGDARLHNFMFNVFAKYPGGIFHPYIGAGIGLSLIDVSGTFTTRTSVSADSEDDTAFAWQVLAGVDIDLSHNLALDLGYRYFHTKANFSHSDIEFETSMVTMGLKFKF